jgi:hypothetical protein
VNDADTDNSLWNRGVRLKAVAGKKGLMVDGTHWPEGTPSANLAEQAKKLYGDRSTELVDGVKPFASFPLAIWSGECAGDRHLSVRFYPIAGGIDQGAGIAYDIGRDGSLELPRRNRTLQAAWLRDLYSEGDSMCKPL